MSEQNVQSWKYAKQQRTTAEAWQNLPNGPRYQNDSFAISIAHCTPPVIVRAGQQSCGGQNYWKTDSGFNDAILEYLVSNWSKVYPEVLEILKKKETKALKDCQEYINTMQKLIDEATE